MKKLLTLALALVVLAVFTGLGASNAVFAADAPGSTPAAKKAKQTLEEGCKDQGGTWTSGRHQGGVCTFTVEKAARKKKQTLEQWCKDHGGTWTSDGHQGGSCAL